MRARLTPLSIEKLPFVQKGMKKYMDSALPGFGVRVTAKSKVYFIVYGTDRRTKTLGKYPVMSLKLARAEAVRLQAAIASDTPLSRLEQLSAARAAYLIECQVKNRPKTVEQYRTYLEKVDKPLLSDVTKDDVDLNSPHAVMTWKVFFNWCIRNELAEKNPFAYLPVSWKKRTRLLTDPEVRKLFAYEYKPYSDYVKLLFLTGQRIGQFKQFMLLEDAVVFPAPVMKNKLEHTIPLTEWSRPLFQGLQPFNGWSRAKRRIDQHTKITDWVQHDARRYVASTLASLQVPIAVTETLLSHSVSQGSSVQDLYNRYNYLRDMRDALTVYEDHIAKVINS